MGEDLVMALSPAEWKLLQLTRSMSRGEVLVTVRNYKLIKADQILRFCEEEETNETN